MKEIIAAFLITLGTWGGYTPPVDTPTLGAFGDPFISIQLADSPVADYILSTDGTDNSWIVNSGGGGTGAEALGDLSDVATTTDTVGYVLKLQADGTFDLEADDDTGSGGAGYAEFIQVGDNQEPVSTTPFLFPNGLMATSSPVIFERSTSSLSLSTAGLFGIGGDWFTSLTGTNLTIDASGVLNASGGGGVNDWQVLPWTVPALTPTSTNDLTGLFVNASSTIAANFRVDGDVNITGSSTTTREVVIDSGKNVGDYFDFYNGTFMEHFDALVQSDGTTASTTLQNVSGGDLTMRFATSTSVLDCTPACAIELTVGSDASPQSNYIYILGSTRALTKSTSSFPANSVEHIRIGYFFCPSLATIQTNDGCYINQNWNDGASDTGGQGDITDIMAWLRAQGSTWFSGVAGNGDASTYLVITAGNVEFKSTAGVIAQKHFHNFSAFDTSAGDEVLIKNWNGDSYHNITNLNDITADSAGVSTSGKWVKIVIWGTANKTADIFEPIIINLPSCSYNSQTAAETDVNGCADFSMPREFSLESSTGFLISSIVYRDQTTWTYGSAVDCRLKNSCGGGTTGGASGVATNFIDNTFTLEDEADGTRIGTFTLNDITTSNTRDISFPDYDFDFNNIIFPANATTSGWFNIGITDLTATIPGLFGAGDLYVGDDATVTGSLSVSSLTDASCDVKSDTNGLLFCGTDAIGGGGTNDWVFGTANNRDYLRPTTTIDLFLPSRLGVGTSTPQALLSVSTSTGNLFGTSLLFQVASTTNTGISDSLVVTADGRTGVGTTTPLSLFQVGDFGQGTFFSVDSLGNATTSANQVVGLDGGAGTTTISMQTDGISGSCIEWTNVENVIYREYVSGAGAKILEVGSCK